MLVDQVKANEVPDELVATASMTSVPNSLDAGATPWPVTVSKNWGDESK